MAMLAFDRDCGLPQPERQVAATGGDVLVFVAGLFAAWFAAGSAGFLAIPLQHATTWLLLAVVVIAARRGKSQGRTWAIRATGTVLAIALTSSPQPVVNVLAVAVLLGAVASTSEQLTSRLTTIAGVAATMLACFRLAYASVPAVRLAADSFGRILGQLTNALTGNHSQIGATFGGIDFLLVAAVVYVAWLSGARPSRRRAVCFATAIVAGHLVYLIAVSTARQLSALLPEPMAPPTSALESNVGVWSWGSGLRMLIPWNLPLLALFIYGAIIAVAVRTSPWFLPESKAPRSERERKSEGDLSGLSLLWEVLCNFGPPLLAITAALLAAWNVPPTDLRGKTIVAYQGDVGQWSRPGYDSTNDGPYGLLPQFVESLGGKTVLSRDLSQAELETADAVLLVTNERPLPKEALERAWNWVRGGGSLLLAVERNHREDGLHMPLRVQVGPEKVTAGTGGWEQSYDAIMHSAMIGIEGVPNPYGVHRSALTVNWPARSLLVGRCGATEYPSESCSLRMGDVPLVAEQRCGDGTAIVLGDAGILQNEAIAGSYPFVGRLLCYLASRPGCWQIVWRQWLTLGAVAAMAVLLCFRTAAWQIMLSAGLMAATLSYAGTVSHSAGRILPCNTKGNVKIGYIDASHLESFGGEPDDRRNARGIAELLRTLACDGYLPLLAPDLSPERLRQAGLLVLIGPSRQFSVAEREAVKRFVADDGGTMICMIGAEEARPTGAMLADFGFTVPPSPVPPDENAREPEPLGAKFSQFTAGNRQYQFYAAWPVEFKDQSLSIWSGWSEGDDTRPIIVSRSEGYGSVVVIADTYFACNDNFETVDRSAKDIATFWRWLLSRVVPGREPWDPLTDGPTKKGGS